MERAVTRIGSREVMPVSNIAASLALVHQVYKEVMKKDTAKVMMNIKKKNIHNNL